MTSRLPAARAIRYASLTLADGAIAALAGDPAQRGDQSDVADGVRELGAPRRLEIRQQVQPPLVIGTVTRPARGDDAERLAAASERAWDQVRRIDPVGGAADDAGPSGDSGALAVGRGQRGCALVAAWSAAAVLGRAAWRAGEAQFASSWFSFDEILIARARPPRQVSAGQRRPLSRGADAPSCFAAVNDERPGGVVPIASGRASSGPSDTSADCQPLRPSRSKAQPSGSVTSSNRRPLSGWRPVKHSPCRPR